MAEIEDERELRNEVLLGLIRIQVGLKPPAHMSVDEALGQFDRMGEREHRQRFYAAADYFVEMLKLALANRLPNDPGSITIPRAEFDGLKADQERLERFAGYIVRRHRDDPPDWACKECVPHSDMLQAGFRCCYHEAKAIDAARKEQGNG